MPEIVFSPNIPAPDPGYDFWPSCSVCQKDYLGRGQCGACLFVRRLVAERDRLRASVNELRRFAWHDEACGSRQNWSAEPPNVAATCDCGLTDLFLAVDGHVSDD